MSMLKKIKGMFKKQKSELEAVNQACNALFQSVFPKCRFDFGRECIHLMELKKDLVDRTDGPRALTSVQQMLAQQMIEIICAFFRLAESLSAIKTGESQGEWVEAYKQDAKGRMDKMMTLAASLHQHIYMRSGHLTPSSFEDQYLLDEAEALCKVLDRENRTKEP